MEKRINLARNLPVRRVFEAACLSGDKTIGILHADLLHEDYRHHEIMD